MKLEPLTQMFLRTQPQLSREEARRKARGFRDMLKQLSDRWRINLELLATAYLDDVEHYPGLTPEQALEHAVTFRRELQRMNRPTHQTTFESRHVPVDFTKTREVGDED